MKELLETLETWRASGIEAGRAVVVRTFGSAPRPEGAVLLLASDGRIAGSVSGGFVGSAPPPEVEPAPRAGDPPVICYRNRHEHAGSVSLACRRTSAMPVPGRGRPGVGGAGPAARVRGRRRRRPGELRRPGAVPRRRRAHRRLAGRGSGRHRPRPERCGRGPEPRPEVR